MNQLDFNGRHAVVTGGATGLGFGIAKRLLASGGSVTVWDRDGEAATKAAWALGAKAYALAVDVAQQPSVAKAVAATLAQAGRIDALVNSAGITGPNTRLWDYPVDAWRQVMEVNLTGLFICCREVVGQFTSVGWETSNRGAKSVNSGRFAVGAGREDSNRSWIATCNRSSGSDWLAVAARIWSAERLRASSNSASSSSCLPSNCR